MSSKVEAGGARVFGFRNSEFKVERGVVGFRLPKL